MSNADKRTVATDALETLGTIIDETAGRDAIHLAVEPVVAAAYLMPGAHVGLLGGGLAGRSPNPVGIVDPFLKEPVRPGGAEVLAGEQGRTAGDGAGQWSRVAGSAGGGGMKYAIEIRLPSGEWAAMQWCGGSFASERDAKRAAASFETFKLPVRVVEHRP